MAEAPKKSVPCPKCGRMLKPSGELNVAGVTMLTYQCDECLRTIDFCGEKTEVALTFAVDKDDHPFDPASGERFRF
jgi:hypothetical protein